MNRLVLVHTVTPLIEVFNHLAKESLPYVQVSHILDEPLLESVRQRGGIAAQDAERLSGHIRQAEQIGADAVLITCSTISPLVDEIRPHTRLKLFKIDEAMISEAVRLGPRIGILATNPTTLSPTRRLLEKHAGELGVMIQIEQILVEGAFSALLRGEGDLHDRLVWGAVQDIAEHVNVVVLAQASMARVLEKTPQGECSVPILASPQLALRKVGEYLAEHTKS